MFISGRFFTKYREKKCRILNNIFRKFEIVVCFAPLLCGVQRNTILNFDSISEIPKAWNLKIALQGGSEEKKEKWDESFSRARATRKKERQRAPAPFPTPFSLTGGASVVVTASVSDLCTLLGSTQESILSKELNNIPIGKRRLLIGGFPDKSGAVAILFFPHLHHKRWSRVFLTSLPDFKMFYFFSVALKVFVLYPLKKFVI